MTYANTVLKQFDWIKKYPDKLPLKVPNIYKPDGNITLKSFFILPLYGILGIFIGLILSYILGIFLTTVGIILIAFWIGILFYILFVILMAVLPGLLIGIAIGTSARKVNLRSRVIAALIALYTNILFYFLPFFLLISHASVEGLNQHIHLITENNIDLFIKLIQVGLVISLVISIFQAYREVGNDLYSSKSNEYLGITKTEYFDVIFVNSILLYLEKWEISKLKELPKASKQDRNIVTLELWTNSTKDVGYLILKMRGRYKGKDTSDDRRVFMSEVDATLISEIVKI
jgi:hypothetical protein